jgi:peptide chain release factor 1
LKARADLAENRALLASEPSDSELALLAREESPGSKPRKKQLAQRVQFGIVPPDPADSRNTIVEIRAGARARNPLCLPPTLPHVHPLCRGARLEV